MRALAIVHEADAGPGVFAQAFDAAGVRLDTWMISSGEHPPAPPQDYDAVCVFGGAMHADQEEAHPWLRTERDLLGELLGEGVPLLGVCLGSQMLAAAAGAEVRPAARPEIGWHGVSVTPAGAADPLTAPLAPGFRAFGWHSYETSLPPGAVALATSEVCLQAYRIGERAWGIQFHAEVSRENLRGWIDGWDNDPDAVRIGLDPEALARESEPLIGEWNRLGRDLCARFCAVAIPRA